MYLIHFTPTFRQLNTQTCTHIHKCFYGDAHKAKQTVCLILASSELGLNNVLWQLFQILMRHWSPTQLHSKTGEGTE